MGSFVGRGNQYIQLVKVLDCKLPTNGKQLPAFLLKVGPGTEPDLRGVTVEHQLEIVLAQTQDLELRQTSRDRSPISRLGWTNLRYIPRAVNG